MDSLFINALPHYLISVGINTLALQQGCTLQKADNKAALIKSLLANPAAVVTLCPHLDGLTTILDITHIAQRFPKAHFLVIIEEPHRQLTVNLTTADNVNLLLLNTEESEALKAIQYTVAHQQYLHPDIISKLNADASGESDSNNPVTLLTPTEQEILRLIATGLSAKEIAAKRFSSVNTIITHKKNIFRKLQVNTAYEAMQIAIRAGLTDPIDYYI